MRRHVSAAGLAALLGMVFLGLAGPAHAASGHADAAPYLIGTVDGTAYAPQALGTVRSAGVVAGRLTFVVHLSGLPQPGQLNGRYYKVWLVAPAAAVVMPGGVLSYHSDGTADGSFTSAYHDFTVLAVTAELSPSGAYPRNDKVMEGSIDVGGLQAALATNVPQLAVTQGQLAASSYSRAPAPSSGPSGGAISGHCCWLE